MADTFTSALGIRQPQTGAYNNAWGSVLNTDMMQLFDDAIAGETSINIGSSSAYSLAAVTPGVAAQGRFFCMQINGSPSAPVVFTLPSSVVSKFYLIDNQTGQPIEFTYVGSADTVTVQNLEKRLMWCDGTNVWNVLSASTDASSLGGVPAANWARVSRTAAEITANTPVHNDFNGVTNANLYTTVTEAPNTTINGNDSNYQILTLTGNRTMTAPSNARDGLEIDLLVVQDSSGDRTLTWNSVFLFEGGVAPTLVTTPGAIDRFNMVYNGALAKWIVAHFGAIATPSGASTIVNVTANTTGFNLLAALGTVVTSITATVNIGHGVVIQSVGTGTPAMDLSGLPSGSTVNLVNLGFIIGCGGDGGDGSIAEYPGSGATVVSASKGRPGGNAIVGPGASNTFNITNGNGRIWGGGGGGGAGGSYDGVSGGHGCGNAGGGGGGAGGGRGGKGGGGVFIDAPNSNGVDGNPGIGGPAGTFGTAGAGSSAGTGQIGTSGNGGDFGANGTDGTPPATVVNGHTARFSTGGTAGKAIELLGAGAPTFLSGAGSPNVKGAVS